MKTANFLNQRKRLLYNDGNFVMLGDHVEYESKAGRIVGTDRQSVNIKFDDGTEKDFVQIENIKKIAKETNMKHLAAIQTEFTKIARKWEKLSIEEQRRYLKKHPKSKRRITHGMNSGTNWSKPKDNTKMPKWYINLTRSEQYDFDADVPKARPSDEDLQERVKYRKKYKMGLSDAVTATNRYKEYVGASHPGGYYGTSNRTAEIDEMLESALQKQGLGPDSIAEWLGSTSARHLMDDMPESQSGQEKRIKEYTKNAFVEVSLWNHPDNQGSVGSFMDLQKKLLEALKNYKDE
jgi:hypothetical protein